MLPFSALTAFPSALACILLSGCATTTLINKDTEMRTKTSKVVLVEDQVVAFGKPAYTSAQLPANIAKFLIIYHNRSYGILNRF